MYKQYCIGRLIEETNDAEEADWVIKMNWDVWEKYCRQDLQGINMDLRLDEYVRSFTPGFVRHRTMAEARPDKLYYVKEYGMQYYNHFDFMVYSRGRAGSDSFYIGVEVDDVYLPNCEKEWIDANPDKVKYIIKTYTRIFEKELFYKLYADIIDSDESIKQKIFNKDWNAVEEFYEAHPEKIEHVSEF
jgi:hypothetical protein